MIHTAVLSLYDDSIVTALFLWVYGHTWLSTDVFLWTIYFTTFSGGTISELLGDPEVTANIYCKSHNLANTYTQDYSTDLR